MPDNLDMQAVVRPGWAEAINNQNFLVLAKPAVLAKSGALGRMRNRVLRRPSRGAELVASAVQKRSEQD